MPPLPPNITKAGLLRSRSGWNNSSLSRRSGTTVGLLSTRTPHSSGNSGGGIPNPSYGVGTIREAFPRGATGTWRPITLSGSINDTQYTFRWDEANSRWVPDDTSNLPSRSPAASSLAVTDLYSRGNNELWMSGLIFATTESRVYQWNGSQWVNRSSGAIAVPDVAIVALAEDQSSNLVAVGTSSAQQFAAIWNGSTWSFLNDNPEDPIGAGSFYNALTYNDGVDFNQLVAVGADGNNKLDAKTWNGTAWSAITTGLPTTEIGFLYATTLFSDELWAAGDYENKMFVSSYDGATWTSRIGNLPTTADGFIADIIAFDGGAWAFAFVDQTSAAIYNTTDGVTWTLRSTGLPANIFANDDFIIAYKLAVRDNDGTDELWVTFPTLTGNVYRTRTYRWNGTDTWINQSTGITEQFSTFQGLQIDLPGGLIDNTNYGFTLARSAFSVVG